jgi:hypothetical protein
MPTPIQFSADEDHVRAEREPLRVDARELHVEVGADGQRDGRRREHEFDERRKARDKAAARPEGAPRIGEGTARMRDRGREFGEAEDEGRVHRGHQHRGHQEAERAGGVPAVAPTKVLTGDDEAHGDAPELERAEHLLQAAVAAWLPWLRSAEGSADEAGAASVACMGLPLFANGDSAHSAKQGPFHRGRRARGRASNILLQAGRARSP